MATKKPTGTGSGKSAKTAPGAPARKPPARGAPARRGELGPAAGDAGAAAALTREEFLTQLPRSGDARLRLGETLVEVTSLQRVYWPGEGITKGDLLAYYLAVGPTLAPYLAGRPAILKRYPTGINGPSFFQHDLDKPPAWLTTATLRNEAGRDVHYAVYTELATLIYLANLGNIAQNPWHSRTSAIDRPDYVVLDLDPHEAPFAHVLEVALATREVLAELGLVGFAKTSGSSGVHIYVPIEPGCTYAQAARFSEVVAGRVAARRPAIATVERRLADRKRDQVYVDWLQNAQGKSVASVYTVRAKPGATVSAPVTWDEVAQGFALADFTIRTMPTRLARLGDLWRGFFDARQALPALG